MALDLVRIDGEDPPEARDVRTRLALWNIDRTGIADWAPMTIVLRDEEGAVRGGVLGSTWAGSLHVTILWIDEAVRGRGHGRRLLEAAEAFGREHGCRQAKLDTFTFQAGPRFYASISAGRSSASSTTIRRDIATTSCGSRSSATCRRRRRSPDHPAG